MKIEEYNKRLFIIDENTRKQKKKLQRDYAFSNNKYKVGDVITDHYHTIRIEKIKWIGTISSTPSQCIYYGIELKKDGTPKKRQQNVGMYQSNIVE